MATTRRGLEIGTDDSDVIDAVDTFTDRLANFGLGVEQIVKDADRWPDLPEVQLCAALLFLYGQTAATDSRAEALLDRANARSDRMDDRQHLMLAALRYWLRTDNLAAVSALERLSQRHPTDMAALKALEYLYYVVGQQHFADRFLAHVESISSQNPDDADFLAVHAFATELTGDPRRARDLAEESVALRHDTPWAHHALAHVYITEGDTGGDRDGLLGFLPSWTEHGRPIYSHNSWHLAVAMLDELDPEAARAIYDEHIWGFQPDAPGEQIDAVSLLWRMEMAGWEVDDNEWSTIADHVEARVDECYMPFLSAHHAYALASAKRDEALERLLTTVHARAERGDDEAERVWRPVGVPIVEACVAHASGDHVRSAGLLDPVMPQMTAVGGSDAQTDLFRQTYLTSLAGAGRHEDARRYWDEMTSWKSRRSALDGRFRERL
jgi:tetratricopeptide (TPR) repeat protein